MNPYHDQSDHFRDLISNLEVILEGYPKNTEELQRRQVTRLMRLERMFRKYLMRTGHGLEVYEKFTDLILNTKRNILLARPYFRERDVTFKAYISQALKNRDYLTITRFNINYQFVAFALNQRTDWAKSEEGRKLLKWADKLKDIRRDLAEINMPLAISQARIFLNRNRRSHLDFLDMNQICFLGLLEGIDKYVGQYHRRFRAVLIGRMLGNLIESSSETYIHFFPPDKRRIYRARKIMGRMGQDSPLDLEEVCRDINLIEIEDNRVDAALEFPKKSKPDPMTTVGELANLLSAAQVLSSSSLSSPSMEDEEDTSAIEKYSGDESIRPDNMFEEAESRRVVANAVQGLSLFDRKILRLKGVELC